MTDLQVHSISFVRFTDEDICNVAEYVGLSEEQVRAYLQDGSLRNRALDRAFHCITGMYPARLVKSKPVPTSGMGSIVPYEPCPECSDA